MRLKTLEDLPDELLREIILFVGKQLHLPRRYRALYILSLISRRLRAFALPLLKHDVTFASSRQFLRAAERWEGGKTTSDHERAALIRSIRIGDPIASRSYAGDLQAWGSCLNPSPFCNLKSFTCVDASASASVLDKLRQSDALAFLTIVWGGCRRLDLQKFQALRTLRIYVDGLMVWSLHSPIIASKGMLSALTKLVIHDLKSCQWSRDIFCGNTCMFPNLRILRLDECAARPIELFSFIQIHASLVEVSVSTNEEHPPIRLEMLKKLIEGTGTWSSEVCEDEYIDGITNDTVILPWTEVDEEEEYLLHYKEEFPNTHIHFDLFAFTRVPITETATLWHSSKGSVCPRYKTTGLAFRIMDQERWQSRDIPIAYIPDVVGLAKDHFPNVEELRVSSDTPCWEGNFQTFMAKVAANVKDLKCLRKLAISWTIPDDWTWAAWMPTLFQDDFLQLNSVVPPTERCSDPTDSDRDDDDDDDWVGKSHSFDELRGLYVDEFVDNLINELRQISGVKEVDTRDDSLYIRTWETYNEWRVAKAMRLIAESCPTLEQIDWYPTGMDSMAETTRWRWTVHRDKSRGVRLVSGNLTWKGCTRNPAAAMHVLLGEELEYEETVHRRRWR